MANYSKRGELVSTSDTTIEAGGSKYRVSISVRYNGAYRIHANVHRLRSTTPHDTIDSTARRVKDKGEVAAEVQALAEWGVERAKEQADALDLNVAIESVVE